MFNRDLGKEIYRFEKSKSDDLVISVSDYKNRRWVHLTTVVQRPNPEFRDLDVEPGHVRAYLLFDASLLKQFLDGIEVLKRELGIVYPEPIQVIIEKTVTTVNPKADNGQETNKEAL